MKSTILFAIAVFALLGCSDKPLQHAPSPLRVTNFEVAQPQTPLSRELIGQVVAAEITPISFRLAGELIELNVKAGDKVKRGDVIAVLDRSKLEQYKKEASNTYDLAQRQLQRATPLFDKGQLSDIEYRELQANLKLAKVDNQYAENRLGYSELIAPFDGMVSAVYKERFESVVAGETIITLYHHDSIYINVPLSFELLAKFTPGKARLDYQPLVSFNNSPSSYPVSLLEYSAEPVSSSRAYEAWFSMPQISPPILPGTSVTLTFDPQAIGMAVQHGFILPYSALQAGSVDKQFYVWKINNGVANRTKVVTSKLTSDGVLVVEGVKQGDVVITSDLEKLREGMAIVSMTSAVAVEK